MSPKNWFLMTLLFGSLFLVGIACFNFVLDPFSQRDTWELTKYDRVRLNRNANVPLWSLLSMRKIDPAVRKASEVIVLGDSRASLLTASENDTVFRTRVVNGQKILNLSLGGGSLKESLSFFEIQNDSADGFAKLKTIVFTVPFNRFCEHERPDRISQGRSMSENPLLYYFSAYTLKKSVRSVRKMGKPQEAQTQKDGDRVLASWADEYSRYDAATVEKRLLKLAKFKQKMDSRNVNVIFYLPPGGASGKQFIAEVGFQKEYADFLAKLERIGTVEYWADRTGVDDRTFSYKIGDPIHHDLGIQVLEKMLSRNERTQTNQQQL